MTGGLFFRSPTRQLRLCPGTAHARPSAGRIYQFRAGVLISTRILRAAGCRTPAMEARARRPCEEKLMPARSIASLSLSFGLLTIPIKLYSATESASTVKFNLLAPDG